jgi:hypothetical protein
MLKICTTLAALALSLIGLVATTAEPAQEVSTRAGGAEADALAPTWLAGHWVGQGFGGTVEEWWSPARGGEMMGAFRLVVDGETKFLELITMSKGAELWSMRLRHFNPDLSSWEKDNQSLLWPEKVLDENRAGFGPVLYELNADGTLHVSVEVGGKEPTTEEFSMRRVH